jgi:hypothetical protein
VVPEKRLSLPETAVLLALMAEAREISNPELKERYGFTLDGKERRHLNDEKLVDSHKRGRAFVHELTDRGWRWCSEELGADGPPARAGSAGGALYAVLAGLRRYLHRAELSLADIFGDDEQRRVPLDVESRIRRAYHDLAEEPRAWVGLADLRSRLPDVARSDLDEALRQMNRLSDVNFIPESNQKALEARDREAAVSIGNQDKHLLSIGA